MSVVYFVDGNPPKPYDSATLRREATGGTTADVVILAEALAHRGHDVYVLQPSPPAGNEGGACYTVLDEDPRRPAPDVVVYLRGLWLIDSGHLSPPEFRRRSPACRFFYWPHVTFPQPFDTWWGKIYGVWRRADRKRLADLLQRQDVGVVGVSAYHAETIRAAWPRLAVDWVYNPVEDETDRYAHIPPSQDRILYASSPERGLLRSIDIVARVRRARPEVRLFVATPGYHDARFHLRLARRRYGAHAIELGHLARPALFAEMRRALCLIQPNTSFLESFGRVYAEAHVLGTPVLTTAMGAAPETVGCADQIFDPRKVQQAVDRILEWADGGRPVVRANPAFAPDAVAVRWEQLIGGS